MWKGRATTRLKTIFDSILFAQFIFLITGIITTIGNQYMFYSGAADKTTLLPVAANYYGMALATVMPRKELHSSSGSLIVLNYKTISLSLLDVTGLSTGMAGIIYAGSGIYQVVYSSVVIFTALWARVFLHKTLSGKHWIAITIVTVGLMCSALGGETITSEDSGKVLIGICLTLFSTMMFSFFYVLTENILTGPNAPTPHQLQATSGTLSASFVTLYLCIWTIPNFRDIVITRVTEQDGSWPAIVIVYAILVLSAFLHSVTFFQLLGSVGAVSTGILQSLRAISVFAISAILFCDSHKNQCFNEYKGLSTALVVLGILYFSKVSAQLSKKIQPSDLDLPETRNH